MRVAAAFNEGAHRLSRLGLAHQHAMHAAAEDLAELPGVEADILPIGAVHRGFHDDRRRAVPRAGRPALDEPAHIFGEARHVEGAMLHADIDVVGPDMRILAPLRIGQHMAAVAAGVIDRLILFEELDGAVDATGHYCLLSERVVERHGRPVDRRSGAIIVPTQGGRGGMADAADSKSVVRDDVEVQVLSPAP